MRMNALKGQQIIAQGIAERLTLLSSDQKFAFYRNQGLDLIEY